LLTFLKSLKFELVTQMSGNSSKREALSLLKSRAISRFYVVAGFCLGKLPIALGWGAGASARRGLGLAVVGGRIVSQVLALYLTPVVHLYFERFQEWFRRARAGHSQKAEIIPTSH
jgi:HAE1 family hydrophobic/amphiphilic exporter-1